MSEPKRYWISDHGMAESECGAWVHYDDWLKLEEARFALEFRLELATKRNAELHALHETVVRERDEAREAIKRQASAARSGMDAATRVSSAQLERAARLRAESNPDALESERAMNAQLTEENEQLRTLLDQAPHVDELDELKVRCAKLAFEEILKWRPAEHNLASNVCDAIMAMQSRIPRAGG